jgi:hypothetical protein
MGKVKSVFTSHDQPYSICILLRFSFLSGVLLGRYVVFRVVGASKPSQNRGTTSSFQVEVQVHKRRFIFGESFPVLPKETH